MERLVIECILRSCLIAAGTGSLLYAFRISSPQLKHLAWTGVTVSMLLLPAWTAWGPKASFRVLPAIGRDVATMEPRTFEISAPLSTSPNESADEFRQATATFRWDWRIVVGSIYLVGVSILVLRLGMGIAGTRRLIRQSSLINGRRSSKDCTSPVTVGILSPIVILPESWPTWPTGQLSAVLAHESEHLRRRDTLVQVLARCNRALFWFHPLAWWLIRQLSLLAEEACDDFVVQQGHNPNDYCSYLCDIARTVASASSRLTALGMPMPGSWLSQRIQRILSVSTPRPVSRPRIVALTFTFLLISASFLAGTLEHRRRQPELPAVYWSVGSKEGKSSLAPRIEATSKTTEGSVVRQAASSQQLQPDMVEGIVVTGHRRIGIDTIMSVVQLKRGATLTPEAVASDVRSIYGLGYFTDVTVSVTSGPQGGKIVTFVVKEKPPNDAFDVASIKRCVPGDGAGKGGRGGAGGRGMQTSPGRLFVNCMSVLEMINVYVLNGGDAPLMNDSPSPMYQERIKGGPAWIRSDLYTVNAETTEPAALGPTTGNSPARKLLMGSMLRILLEDRFRLKVHREAEEVPMYALTVAKTGLKIGPTVPGDCIPFDTTKPLKTSDMFPAGQKPLCVQWTHWDGPDWVIDGAGQPLSRLAAALSGMMDRRVVDKTGDANSFSYHLVFAHDGSTPGEFPSGLSPFPDSDSLSASPSVFTVLERDLGLKLVSDKGSHEYLVIDNVQKPSPNLD